MAVNWLDKNQVEAFKQEAVKQWSPEEVDAYINQKTQGAYQTRPKPPEPIPEPQSLLNKFVEGSPDENLVQRVAGGIGRAVTAAPRIVGELAHQTSNLFKGNTPEPPSFHELSARVDSGEITAEQAMAILDAYTKGQQEDIDKWDAKYIKQSEVNQISGKPLKGALLGAKKGLSTASFLVPGAGPTANIGQVMGRGAITGAMAGAGQEQDELSLLGTLGQAAVGAGTGAAVAGTLRGLGNFGRWLKKTKSGKGAKITSEMASSRINKASPAKIDEVTEHLGESMDDLTVKHWGKGEGYDDVLGPLSDKGRGGTWGNKLEVAGDQIEEALPSGRSAPKIAIKDYVDDLKTEQKLLKKIIGNEREVKALGKIIKNAEQQYKNGLTPKQAYIIRKGIDSDFGKKVVEEKTGSVAVQAQKRLANYLRGELKDAYPMAADALDTQSEILTLRPIIMRARAQASSQGSEFSLGRINSIGEALDPLKWTERALQKPQYASKFLRQPTQEVTEEVAKGLPAVPPPLETAGAFGTDKLVSPILNKAQTVPAVTDALKQSVLPTLAARGTTKSIGQGSTVPDLVNGEGLAPEGTVPQQKATVTYNDVEYDRDKLYELKLANVDNPGGNKIIKILEEQLTAKEEELAGSGEFVPKTEGDMNRVEASNAVDEALGLWTANSDIKTGMVGGRFEQIKGAFGAADPETLAFNTAISNVRHAISKARAGTALSASEEKMLNKYTPNVGDSAQQLRIKLAGLRKGYDEMFAAKMQKGKGISLDEITE